MWKYVAPSGATPPFILKHLIYLANREPQEAKDENRNHLYCRSKSTRGGASRGQGEGTNVEATSGARGGYASPS